MGGVRTSRARIAEYWLGTEEGRARYPKNPALMDFGEPHCFACAEPGNWPDGQLWSLWNRSGLERCHLVPRMLGGEDSPENLVLLCGECHHDAPDVGDPGYMLEWMTRRESKFARIGRLIAEAIEAADLKEELDRLDRDHRSLDRRFPPAGRDKSAFGQRWATIPRPMAVPKKRTSSARRDKRRAQHKAAKPSINRCPRCHSPRIPHRVCPTCGTYAGREVVAQRISDPTAGHSHE